MFEYRVLYEQLVRPRRALLSFTDLQVASKSIIHAEATTRDRLAPWEHYARFPEKPRFPLVAAGVRNVLSNLRCIAYSRAMSQYFRFPPNSLATVAEEAPQPGRPYHALGYADGEFSMEEFMPQGSVHDVQPQLDRWEWLVTGTPVLWDDNDDLFDRMITDCADHAHVWHLPRGRHPLATDATRLQYEQMRHIFKGTLSADRTTAAGQMRELADRCGLRREGEYLHAVWGLRSPSELLILIGNGRLEALGEHMRSQGVRRAICVENGGSIAAYWLPDETTIPWIPLLRAPNYRPAGTCFAFFQLDAPQFDVLR
jgi:hypothetical protein